MHAVREPGDINIQALMMLGLTQRKWPTSDVHPSSSSGLRLSGAAAAAGCSGRTCRRLLPRQARQQRRLARSDRAEYQTL